MYLVSSKTCRRFHSLLYLKIMLMDKISFFVVDCGRPRLGRALFIHFPSILPQFFFSMAFFLYLSFISFHACAQLPVIFFVCMILWSFMQTCWRFFFSLSFSILLKSLSHVYPGVLHKGFDDIPSICRPCVKRHVSCNQIHDY